MNEEKAKAGVQISKQSFITSAVILFALMMFAGILTLVVPQGGYSRELMDGREVVTAGSFMYVEGIRLPVWRWFTAPFEVLVGSDAATVIVIIFFIMSIGGSIAVLDKSGMLRVFMLSVTKKFRNNKYTLMAILILCFMLFGSTFGMFEETIALTPIVIALAYALGWDSLTGIGMSALSAGFGFTCALTNPFTCGIAQKLAGLPLFSGVLFRIVFFAVTYAILYLFISRYAKKVEADPKLSDVYEEDLKQKTKYLNMPSDISENEANVLKAISVFKIFLALCAVVIISGIAVPVLTDLSLPLVAIIFLAGSLISGYRVRYTKKVHRDFLEGIGGIAPGIILILLAMSVKHIIENGQIMDTILYYSSNALMGKGAFLSTILIYVLVMVMNFFIGSGSAKAFLIIPIVAPLAELTGVTRQTAVLAFLFGDGFSNVIYPTNPVLMILLGLTAVSYTKWLKWTIKLQALMFMLSIAALFVAVLIGYGPF